MKIKPGATEHIKPHLASGEQQSALGFPEQLIDNWQTKAIELLGEKVQGSRALQVAMDACMKCGACTDKCHYYQGTQDPNNMPVARQELMRSVYKRHYTYSGKYLPWLVGAKDLDRNMLDQWYTYFHQCSQCRRCSVYCPVGIDTSEVSMAGRDILAQVGMGQKYSNQIIGKVALKGNNLGLPGPALKDTLLGLEEDVLEETGVTVRFPLDEAGADVLLVTPSADFFAEPHVDGLIGYAKVMHQAGISWTLSTQAAEAANFGLFIGSEQHTRDMALRIKQAAQHLGVKRLVFGECGHAWRVAQNHLKALVDGLDFLDTRYPVPQHIAEVTHELWTQGVIRFNAEKNSHRCITFHDSCNVARASSLGTIKGGQYSIPRDLLKAACERFVEMPADTTQQTTLCCGGGGGLLTDELMELRIKGAAARMNAFDKVVAQQQVTHMVAMCAICKSQFATVFPEFGHAFDSVLSLHQVLGDALDLTPSS